MLVAGKFEVVRELGRGAFGVVFEARDTYLDRPVAIKTIRDDHFSSASSREAFEKRFLREARSVARLQHPNIIAVYEAGRDGEMSFIAMEFVRGRTLRDVLAARRVLPPGEVLAVADALLSALDYAHTQGIVHRDIKPENVMVREDGALKVADFGIAKALHAESTTLTKDGAVMGTPSYMPPEQVLGKPVDGRADMFSAAALLYECLTGEKPFAGDNLPALVHQILTAAPRPVSPALRVPPHMLAAVMRGLAKEPDQRFRTCGELLAALRGAAPTSATLDHNRTIPAAPLPQPSGHTFQGVLTKLPDPHAATLPGEPAAGGGGSSLLAVGVAAAIFLGLVLLTGGAAAVYMLTRPTPRVADRPPAGAPATPPAAPDRHAPPSTRTAPSPAPRGPSTPPEVAPPRASPRPSPAPSGDAGDDDAPPRVDPSEQARAELDAMAAMVRRQIESGNWNNLADHYATDAVIINGDGTFVGRGTIDAYFRTAAAVLLATAPGQHISWGYRWLELESDGGSAVALTENTFHVGGTLVDHSVTRVNYRKAGGRWLITRAEWQPGMDPASYEARDRSDEKKRGKKKKEEREDDDGGGVEIDLTLPRRLPRGLPLPGR